MDLEQLKSRNSADLQTLTQPYQPVVYAIPKAQWEAMMALMTRNLPAMQEDIAYLATQESLETYQQKITQSLCKLTNQLDDQQREISAQAGKMGDESSRKIAALERSLTNLSEQFQRNSWKKITFLLGAQTMFLALLTILLKMILK